jgi:hypothetical protein
MLKESSPEVGAASHAACSTSSLLANGLEVLGRKMGHVFAGQVTPEVFDGVEFGRIGRKVFGRQPRCLASKVGLDPSAAMRRKTIPQQNHFPTFDVTFERPQIVDDLRLLDRAGVQPQTQPDAASRRSGDQTGDGRQPFPIERRDDHRCLPTRCPSATDAGTFGKPTLIQENQQAVRIAGLFLMAGQRCRNQQRIDASFRSRARRSGRWQDHPSRPRSFQT